MVPFRLILKFHRVMECNWTVRYKNAPATSYKHERSVYKRLARGWLQFLRCIFKIVKTFNHTVKITTIVTGNLVCPYTKKERKNETHVGINSSRAINGWNSSHIDPWDTVSLGGSSVLTFGRIILSHFVTEWSLSMVSGQCMDSGRGMPALDRVQDSLDFGIQMRMLKD